MPVLTEEEMNRLSELSKRYAVSGNAQDSLTEDEWTFVVDMCIKLAKSAR